MTPQPAYDVPNPDRVPGKLERILAELRGADVLPWDFKTRATYTTIVPQMVRWLSADEAARWLADFNAELTRLGL